MKHTILLILGVAIVVLCGQDVIRLLLDSSAQSIFRWLPGDRLAYILVDIVLILAAGALASWAQKKR